MANKTLRQMFWSVNRFFFKRTLKHQFNYTYSPNCDELPDSAFIMVANHACFFDPWLIAHPSPRAVSIMMNEEAYKSKAITRWYLEKIGTFPKKKGGSDIRSMKIALKRLAAGSPLLIFPEGQTSWDGETQPIYSGIEKLILRSKLPLVMVNLSGNFISRPWWSNNDRKGTIIVDRKVISPEELAKTKADELRDKIIKHIKNNDCKNELLKDTTFTCDAPANGIDRLLWCCPHCKSENSLEYSDKSVKCTSCNEEFTINPNLSVESPNCKSILDIHDWVGFQKSVVKGKIAESAPDVILAEKAGIQLVDVDYSGRTISLDTGKLSLSKEALTYYGEHGTLEFKIDEITQPVFQKKDFIHFEQKSGGETRFLIEDDALFKWLMYLRYLTDYDKSEEQGYY